MRGELLAYFISFHPYASWLHGDDRGSVDPNHNIPGQHFVDPNSDRLKSEQSRRKHDATTLDREQRAVVQSTIIEVCRHRQWQLHAVHVRTTHVHIVVTASSHSPERVMNDFKSWSTRKMVELNVMPAKTKAWSRHGSTRYLWNAGAVAECVDYVMNRQGESLHGGPEPYLGDFVTDPTQSIE